MGFSILFIVPHLNFSQTGLMEDTADLEVTETLSAGSKRSRPPSASSSGWPSQKRRSCDSELSTQTDQPMLCDPPMCSTDISESTKTQLLSYALQMLSPGPTPSSSRFKTTSSRSDSSTHLVQFVQATSGCLYSETSSGSSLCLLPLRAVTRSSWVRLVAELLSRANLPPTNLRSLRAMSL